MLKETFCAPATPPVRSSIAIIRINGPQTKEILQKLLSKEFAPRHAVYGVLRDPDIDENIDDVLALYFKGPASYTGDDCGEIHCHGNPIIVQKILSLLHRNGIRMAEPGEFSKEAFLNGKMDLTAAEAVNHIITATSEWEIESALKQMHGSLRNAVNDVKDVLIELKADIEADIDFIEQDIEVISYDDASLKSKEVTERVSSILNRCKAGRQISRGIDVTIAGKPNVGKSSLLNLILNEERAIVSSVPGTTRDIIQESVIIKGVQINLIDTAGIDKPGDDIERIGIELSYKNIEKASLVLMVIDSVKGIESADEKIIKQLANKDFFFIVNKIDLVDNEGCESIIKSLSKYGKPIVQMSASKGTGLSDLEDAIHNYLTQHLVDHHNSFAADQRVVDLLEESMGLMKNITSLIDVKETSPIIAHELQEVIFTLAGITGEITPDEVLGSVFSRFCIGK
jgi:tRNA modification GTPase